MRVLKWLIPVALRRPQELSEALIAASLRMIRRQTFELEPGHWAIVGEVKDTYRASLHLWADDDKIDLRVASEIRIERDWLPRELLLMLLEENQQFELGSFRLVQDGEQRLVCLGRTIEARATAELQLVHLCEALIERYQRMVTKLFAMGLLIPGPHPTDFAQGASDPV